MMVAATTGAIAACADLAAPRDGSLTFDALLAALSTAPIGHGSLTTSYVGDDIGGIANTGLWLAGGREAAFDRGEMMGGGLHDEFVGSMSFGAGRGHHGPFGGGLRCTGTFNASTGRVVCPDETRNGLTVKRSAAYTSATGTVQQAFDSLTTNTVNLKTDVSGTVTFTRGADTARGGRRPNRGPGGPGGRLLGDTATILTASTTINSSSDRTTTGLAQGQTQRTTNGTSRGQESTTGTSSRGAFTATRLVGDTTRGLIIPRRAAGDTTKTYPTAGTVIRQMSATVTYTGQSPVSVTRREVVTYDGSATAKVVITENGTTRTCTRPLPRGRLSCS